MVVVPLLLPSSGSSHRRVPCGSGLGSRTAEQGRKASAKLHELLFL